MRRKQKHVARRSILYHIYFASNLYFFLVYDFEAIKKTGGDKAVDITKEPDLTESNILKDLVEDFKKFLIKGNSGLKILKQLRILVYLIFIYYRRNQTWIWKM